MHAVEELRMVDEVAVRRAAETTAGRCTGRRILTSTHRTAPAICTGDRKSEKMIPKNSPASG
jgi:hypothetical protein